MYLLPQGINIIQSMTPSIDYFSLITDQSQPFNDLDCTCIQKFQHFYSSFYICCFIITQDILVHLNLYKFSNNMININTCLMIFFQYFILIIFQSSFFIFYHDALFYYILLNQFFKWQKIQFEMVKIFALIALILILAVAKVIKINDFHQKQSRNQDVDNSLRNQDSNYQDQHVEMDKHQKGWMKKRNKIQEAIQNGQDIHGINSVGKFKGWMKKYFRSYGPEERQLRLSYFLANLKNIQRHNSKKSSFKMEANKFADYSDQEFQKYFLMEKAPQLKIKITAPHIQPQQNNQSRLLQTITSIDWRTKVKFGQIKNQGKCAACYAFADIGAVEIHRSIRYKYSPLPVLSEQQIIDCCSEMGYQCDGCKSGNMGGTLKFLAQYGISSLKDYPYTGVVDRCRLKWIKTSKFLKIARPYYQMYGQEHVTTYLIKYGPLATAVDARTWKFYREGVFDECPTGNFTFTHGAVIIGMQLNVSWKLKNSWGKDWGNEGYIDISWAKDCGILNYVFLPLMI